MLYPNESEMIYDAIQEVWKEFRGAFKESIVERSLEIAFRNHNFNIERQKRINIYFNQELVGTYVPDFILNDIILIELKSKAYITQEDERQFWRYLRATPYRLGFLVNFGSQGLEIKRRIYDQARNNSKQSYIIPRWSRQVAYRRI